MKPSGQRPFFSSGGQESGGLIAPFLDGRIDGLLIYPGFLGGGGEDVGDPRPARLEAAGLPAVLVGRSLSVPPGCGAVFLFSPDSRSLVTASSDGTARVWDATTGRERLRP